MSSTTIDAILALVAVEAAALMFYRTKSKRGMPVAEVVSFLGAGAALMIALRVLATGGGFATFAVAMLVSLAMHLWHVKQRWL